MPAPIIMGRPVPRAISQVCLVFSTFAVVQGLFLRYSSAAAASASSSSRDTLWSLSGYAPASSGVFFTKTIMMTARMMHNAAMHQKKPDTPQPAPTKPRIIGLSAADAKVVPMVANPMKLPLVRGNQLDPNAPTPTVAYATMQM